MYSAKLSNGFPTTFGTSGLLYRSNKIMYDRATDSLWHQLTGEPVVGLLAGSGYKLDFFPVVLTTWEEWVGLHPDTTVLDIETGLYSGSFYVPESNPRAIYNQYFNSPTTMFPVPFRDDRLTIKDIVLGVGIGGSYKAYPVNALRRDLVVNDVVGGTQIVVVGSAGSESARVYEAEGRRFDAPDGGALDLGPVEEVVDGDGVTWMVTEEHLVNGEDPDQKLDRIPTHMSFWFGWYQFHPDTELYTSEGE